ncbi:hypothetical protein CV770_31425 [Bradyrhizobium sp. AC87j1]|uniref:DUF6894 family protein n=1 Tax=Bradyrhizobium sp. AC87j1 TaxID=2055894 RepID=UPI000CEC072A|nr:hypothetical protein [Bradyrhizobium sp. AC87j1]PPQ15473.1 hypothetical protein CV770_31425 [Bradyrhizobium sp. AC87j1]
MIAAVEGSPKQRYYFPIIHNGLLRPDDEGEMFGSADLAGQYGASVARDIGGDPNCDRDAGTVVIVVDAMDAEIAWHTVGDAEPPRAL